MTEPAYTEQDLRDAETLHNRVHEVAALVSCPEGIEIGWAPEEAIPIIAAEFSHIRSEAVAGMREACAEWLEKHGNVMFNGVNLADGIRSLPDKAADEAIERIRAEAERKGRIKEAEWFRDNGCWADGTKRVVALEGKESSRG